MRIYISNELRVSQELIEGGLIVIYFGEEIRTVEKGSGLAYIECAACPEGIASVGDFVTSAIETLEEEVFL